MNKIKPILWNFKGKKLVVTDHAISRFVERWPEYSSLALYEPEARLKRLLFASSPEEVGILFRAYRALSSRNFRLANYYRYERWRFIVVNDGAEQTLVTVELDK